MAYDQYPDEKDRLKFLAPITNFKTGIKAKTRWVVYAMMMIDENRILGRLDLPVSVKEKLNEMAVDADEDESVIQTDPFTDPDEGHCIIITYNKDAKQAADYYKATLDFKKSTPVTDDELDWLAEQPTLESMLVNSYSMKDFDLAIEGLKRFDEENKYNIFASDDFLDKLEEISKKVPIAESEELKESSPKKSKKAEIVNKGKVEEKKSDLPFDLDLEEMSLDQLKGIIRREELDIRVLSKYTEEDLIEMINEERSLKKSTNTPKKEEEEEEEDDFPRTKRSSRLSQLSEDMEEE